jgi:hypothetical protein
VNSSVADDLGLVIAFTVAFTSTVPAACGGAITVQLVLLAQLTDFDLTEPNLKVVAVVPRAKPVPVTVTLVPPATGPEPGLTELMVGVYLKWSAVVMALVPAPVVTVTSTVPTVPAGAVTSSFVEELTV